MTRQMFSSWTEESDLLEPDLRAENDTGTAFGGEWVAYHSKHMWLDCTCTSSSQRQPEDGGKHRHHTAGLWRSLAHPRRDRHAASCQRRCSAEKILLLKELQTHRWRKKYYENSLKTSSGM